MEAQRSDMSVLDPEQSNSPTSSDTASNRQSTHEDVFEPKHEIETLATEIPRKNSDVSDRNTLGGRPWKTTLLRFAPLAGIACMLLAILSILVSLGVLMGSRNSLANWGVPPSSILAICTAVSNQALRFAGFQGCAIGWWFRASRGYTLGELHTDWRAGTTVVGAISAGRNMGFLGLACLLSTFVALDGPFLQRATTITSAPIVNQTVSLNVTLAPEIPTGFTGTWWESEYRWFPMFNSTFPTSAGRS